MQRITLTKEEKRAVKCIIKGQRKSAKHYQNRIVVDAGVVYMTDIHRFIAFRTVSEVKDGEYTIEGEIIEKCETTVYPDLKVFRDFLQKEGLRHYVGALACALHVMANPYNTDYIREIGSGTDSIDCYHEDCHLSPTVIVNKGVAWAIMPLRDEGKDEEIKGFQFSELF
jgi:hypothetical protein